MIKYFFTLSSLFFCFQNFAQKNLSLLANLPYSSQLSSIWGYVDDNGNEYALVGTKDGVSIVDVTDAQNPLEVKVINDTSSIWRELKVWNKHAYVTNEAGNGLLIIDLSSLPNASGITSSHYNGNGMTTGHTISIDENGIAYVFGTDIAQGALILDLSTPSSPTVLGSYVDNYIHDGFVRGDTLWAGAIYAGNFLVLDMSTKSNPVLLSSQTTPGVFTHNCWISDNGKYLFTTDEVTNSYVTSYDVSDLSDIKELDRYQSNPGSNAIVHNTHLVNSDYLVNAYYKEGVTIVDVTYPDNMIEVGNYDTYSQGSGDGMTGCWGVYPYLPSGNILASDMVNGLFILKPTYQKACYLEGKVTDKATSASLYAVTVEILGEASATTNLVGDYATGVTDAATYEVVYSKPGYVSDTVTVNLSTGIVTTQDVQLVQKVTYSVSVQVVDTNGNIIEDANVSILNADFNFSGSTDTSGTYQDTAVYGDEYSIIVGKWGYITECLTEQDIPNTTSFTITLASGYYDDFTFDFGWTESGTAVSGNWERGEPVGTEYGYYPVEEANPEYDADGDCSDQCFVSGNAGGESGDDDVDDGYTILTSPVFDLSTYSDPYLSYSRWFFNKGGSGSPDDTLMIMISDGTTTVSLEEVTKNNTQQSTWMEKSFKISDYITPSSNMQLMVYTADQANTGHLVEVGFDVFQISESSTIGINEVELTNASIEIYPNPVVDYMLIQYEFDENIRLQNAYITIQNSLGQSIISKPINEISGTIFLSEKLPSGMYVVTLYNNNINYSSKRIIQIQ